MAVLPLGVFRLWQKVMNKLHFLNKKLITVICNKQTDRNTRSSEVPTEYVRSRSIKTCRSFVWHANMLRKFVWYCFFSFHIRIKLLTLVRRRRFPWWWLISKDQERDESPAIASRTPPWQDGCSLVKVRGRYRLLCSVRHNPEFISAFFQPSLTLSRLSLTPFFLRATWNKPESKQFYCSVVSLIVMKKDYVDFRKPPWQDIF